MLFDEKDKKWFPPTQFSEWFPTRALDGELFWQTLINARP